jgi:hypothetical protein
MAALVNDIVGRLYLNGDWQDISSLIRAERGIRYRRGRRSEDDVTPPQTCEFTLDNTSGDFYERNPQGQYYESLGRSTPFELALRLAKDTCTASASNGWGSTEAHTDGAFPAYTWTPSGGATSSYAKSSGKATHLVSSAGQARTSYLASFAARDIEVSLTVHADVADVTGGALDEGMAIANIMVRGQGALSAFYMFRLVVQTDETITTDWHSHAGTMTGLAAPTEETYSAGTPIKVRVQVEGSALRSKVWLAGSSEPYRWTDVWVDEGDDTDTEALCTAQGWVGVRSELLAGNTNSNVTVSYDDIEVKSLTFAGEIARWPQARDESGNDKTVKVTAAGVRRRHAQGKTLLRSALRSYHLFWPEHAAVTKAPSAYWPLEEGARAVTSAINAVAGSGSSLQFVPPTAGSTVGKIKWGGNTERAGSKQSVTLTGGASLVANISPVTAASAWAIQWQHLFNYIDGGFFYFSTDTASGSGISLIGILNPGTLTLEIGLEAPGVAASILSHTFTDRSTVESWHTMAVSAEQAGSATFFSLYVDGNVADTHLQGSLLLQGLKRAQFSSVTNASGDTGFGHIAVYSGDLGTWNYPAAAEAAEGYVGELPVFRLRQLVSDSGLPFEWIGRGGLTNFGDGKRMGPQRTATLSDLINDAERVDGGLLCEQRGLVGLQMRTLRSMYSRSSWCVLDMATSKHFSPPWEPTSDDRLVANEVTANRTEGSEYTYSLDEGRMSTLPPADGGVGRYPKSITYNVDQEADLPDLASWQVALGTIDEERYPAIRMELHRSAILDTPGLLSKLRDLDIGDQITLAGLAGTGIYDDRDELVIGYDGELNRHQHTLTLVTTPASLLRVWTIGDTVETASEFARVDSDYTTLNEDLTDTETDVTVTVESGKAFWVDSTSHANQFPFDVVTGGEVMTVTAGTAPSGQQQTWTVTRSVNGVMKSHNAGQKISLARPNYYGL